MNYLKTKKKKLQLLFSPNIIKNITFYKITLRILLQKKYNLLRPPTNKIYKKNNLSIFKINKNANKIYYQNLYLLTKLFLNHKTLYYNIKPFLFYILTLNNKYKNHLIKYFSKINNYTLYTQPYFKYTYKYSKLKRNLSKIYDYRTLITFNNSQNYFKTLFIFIY